MLIFCFKFSHVHDLSLYCQHHYLILPVSSTQVLPSVWCIDHVMAGCGWQEFWRGKMWIGCACFSLDITWVLCFKQWGACTQQKVLRGQGKYLEWLNTEYIQHCVLITSVWLYLFFSLLCPPLPRTQGRAWSTTVLTALFATLDTPVLPSTCYIKPMGMHESWATLAIIPGDVADACLLEKCHSHPQPMEELTLGDAWNCLRDTCSASPPAVIMSSISFREHIFWEAALCGLPI